MKTNNCEELLGRPDKGQSIATGVLTLLFRKILDERDVRFSHLNSAVSSYLNDPTNGYVGDNKKISSERSNIQKEISRSTMTWKVFRKLIWILGVKKMKVEVHLDWGTGPNAITTHSVDIGVSSTLFNEEED